MVPKKVMKHLYIAVLIALPLLSTAQELEASWSRFTEVEPTDKARIIGVTDERIVVAVQNNDKTKAKLVEYGREFGSYTALEAEFENESVVYVDILRGHTTVFSTKKGNNGLDLYWRTVTDGGFSQAQLLCSSVFTSSDFDFSKSPDGSHFGVIANAPYQKGKNEELETWIFDSSLKEKMAYTLALKNDNRKIKVNVPVMSNTGVLFLLKRFRVGLENNYQVFAIDPAEKKHTLKTLTLMGKRVADVKYELDAENNLHLAGFYVSQSYNVYEGSFYFKLDQTARSLGFKQNAFSEEFLIKAEGKKMYKKHGGLVDFNITEMMMKNGKIYLTASHSVKERINNGSENLTLFRKEKMALVCLKPDGSSDYIKILKLDQHSNNDGGFWNNHKLLPKEGEGLLVGHNVKDDEKVTFLVSNENGDEFTTKDLSNIYAESDVSIGLNLNDTYFTKDKEMVVTGWSLDKSRYTVGIVKKKE